MRRRDIKLDKYEISKNAYRELHYFCMQYHEKKSRLKLMRELSAAPLSASVKGGAVGNPTESKVIKAAQIADDCDLIESTALEAGEHVSMWLLRAVTLDLSWEVLKPPMGRRQFYESRRRFYYLLALKKGMI